MSVKSGKSQSQIEPDQVKTSESQKKVKGKSDQVKSKQVKTLNQIKYITILAALLKTKLQSALQGLKQFELRWINSDNNNKNNLNGNAGH